MVALGLAPASPRLCDSIPPMPSGGNLDNKRSGVLFKSKSPVVTQPGRAPCRQVAERRHLVTVRALDGFPVVLCGRRLVVVQAEKYGNAVYLTAPHFAGAEDGT
jgi:hypothetical protein